MWKNTCQVIQNQPLLKTNLNLLATVRCVTNSEIASRYRQKPKVGWWRRRGTRMLYPTSDPAYLRQIGVDLNLQERLDEMFKEENAEIKSKSVDIGFPAIKTSNNKINQKSSMKERRKDRKLEKAARTNTLNVDLEAVKSEHEASGGLFQDIRKAAELYGIYEDLFDHAYFNPVVNLIIEYDYQDDIITPVLRGNVIKPKEAETTPNIHYESDPESLWTLILTNPDGHFTEENSEYLHWMVTNIKGNDIASGQVVAPYLQPFPPFGTGFHRFVFLLFKQEKLLDLAKYQQPTEEILLSSRTFKTKDFLSENQESIKPAGLAFFQSDWDSSLTHFYHHALNMKEPRYEYDFAPPYTTPWNEKMPRIFTPFNFFLDTKREPKEIQEEVLKKKLKLTHPFKGQLDKDIKFPNAHEPFFYYHKDKAKHGSWRIREIERERLRQGVYKDMDWTELRRDPSNS